MSHVHAYHRKKLGKSTIYKCMLPDCNHFIQKDLIEGRKCICSRCFFPFVITKKILKNCGAKPHCEECYGLSNRDKKKEAILDKMLENLIGE